MVATLLWMRVASARSFVLRTIGRRDPGGAKKRNDRYHCLSPYTSAFLCPDKSPKRINRVVIYPIFATAASLRSMNVLLSALPQEHGRHGVEFVCGHCGANSLRLIGVSEKVVRVDCLSCGKESMAERAASSTSPASPSGRASAKNP
jgi:hypothetical protein